MAGPRLRCRGRDPGADNPGADDHDVQRHGGRGRQRRHRNHWNHWNRRDRRAGDPRPGPADVRRRLHRAQQPGASPGGPRHGLGQERPRHWTVAEYQQRVAVGLAADGAAHRIDLPAVGSDEHDEHDDRRSRMSSLRRDLIERKLWIVVALLVVGLIAVPMLLLKSVRRWCAHRAGAAGGIDGVDHHLGRSPDGDARQFQSRPRCCWRGSLATRSRAACPS